MTDVSSFFKAKNSHKKITLENTKLLIFDLYVTLVDTERISVDC